MITRHLNVSARPHAGDAASALEWVGVPLLHVTPSHSELMISRLATSFLSCPVEQSREELLQNYEDQCVCCGNKRVNKTRRTVVYFISLGGYSIIQRSVV